MSFNNGVVIRSLLSYPIFRLTLVYALGILLGDWFYGCPGFRFWAECAGCISFVVACICYRLSDYNKRFFFGVAVSVAVMAGGAVLITNVRDKVFHEWDNEPKLYKGEIIDSPQTNSKTWRSVVKLDSIDRKIMLYMMFDSLQACPKCGDKVIFKAQVKPVVSDSNTIWSGYGKYLMNQGISGTAVAYKGNWERLGQKQNLSLRQRALLFRDKIVALYHDWGLEEDRLAIVMTLSVGDKRDLDKGLKSAYNAAGASHVLALSGLHVGMVSALLMVLFSPLKRFAHGRIIIEALSILLLWCFAFVSGLSPSVVRAVTLFSLYIIASWINGGQMAGLLVLSLTALLMLLFRPQYLFDVGFQMTFASMFSIFLIMPMFYGLMRSESRLIRWTIGIVSVAFSAQAGVFPLVMHYFGVFPSYFLLTSFVVIPLATCVVWLTIASLVLSWVPYVCSLAVGLLSAVVGFMNEAMYLIGGLPGSQIQSHITSLQAALTYIFIIAIVSFLNKRSFVRLVSVIISCCLLLSTGIIHMLWGSI